MPCNDPLLGVSRKHISDSIHLANSSVSIGGVLLAMLTIFAMASKRLTRRCWVGARRVSQLAHGVPGVTRAQVGGEKAGLNRRAEQPVARDKSRSCTNTGSWPSGTSARPSPAGPRRLVAGSS